MERDGACCAVCTRSGSALVRSFYSLLIQSHQTKRYERMKLVSSRMRVTLLERTEEGQNKQQHIDSWDTEFR